MLERAKRWVGNLIQRVGEATGIGREFRSIFDLSGVPAFQQFYDFGIFPWKWVYKGFYSKWHVIPAPTIENPRAKRNLYYLNLAKAICSELAGMIWTDGADISITTNGFTPTEAAPDDPLGKWVQGVLKWNHFTEKMQEAIEQSAALGGEAMKVWRDVRRDNAGDEVPGSEKIKIGWCMADQFVPTAWDNAGITEGCFISRQAKDGFYYTRLEWHKWDGLTYYITNELYRAPEKKDGVAETQDILGIRIPLATIYPLLDEETTVEGLETSLFSYFRPPMANNIDDNSPLGVSVYASAMETLHALDICFDSFVREFRLGKKRIIVPARMIKTIVDPVTHEARRYFDATDETYEALSTDDPDSLKIQDNSVALRVEEHVSAMNAFLNILCLQLGLSAGTFSFDVHGGIKTATEVVSENSKTYKTVKNYQNMIRPAIEQLVDNIIAVGALYDMQTEDGQSIAELKNRGYEVTVTLDDGITQDRQTNINEGIMLVNSGLMSKLTFLTDPKYGQGWTDEAAERELARIAAEQKASPPFGGDVIDSIFANTAE